jgi:hypothetical protein
MRFEFRHLWLLVAARQHLSRNAYRNRIWRDIAKHHSIRPNRGIVPDGYPSQKFRAGAYVYPISYAGRAPHSSVAQAYGDAVSDDAVIAKLRIAAYDNPSDVFYDEAPADHRLAGELGAEQHLGEEPKHLVKKR